MKQQLSKNLQLSPSVFHPPFLPVCPRRVDWHQGRNHSLSRSIRLNIEILIWSSCFSAVSFSKTVCERLSAGGYPVENKVEIINPSKTGPWNMNDSCRALLVSGGRSLDPLGKVHCSRSPYSAKSMKRKDNQTRSEDVDYERVKKPVFCRSETLEKEDPKMGKE